MAQSALGKDSQGSFAEARRRRGYTQFATLRSGHRLETTQSIRALNWEDCLEIQKAVQAANVKTCVCFECRFSSQFRTIKSIIDQGLLGRIHYAEVDYYHGIGPWYGQFRWNTKKEAGGSSLLSAG